MSLFPTPIEQSHISCLKRVAGDERCTWKGLSHFKADVWSGVVAYNLALCAHLNLESG